MSENLKERLKAKARHNMEFVTIGLYSLSPDDAAEVVADWLESEALADTMADCAAQNAYYLRYSERPDNPADLMEAYRLGGAWDREVNASRAVLTALASTPQGPIT